MKLGRSIALMATMLVAGSMFGQPSAKGSVPARTTCQVSVSGFGLSESADGPQSTISWNEVDRGKFLHIHVLATLPGGITSLKGKYRKAGGAGKTPSSDIDLPDGKPGPGGYFEFVLTHYTLDSSTTYVVRVADAFSGDVKCAATDTIETKAE